MRHHDWQLKFEAFVAARAHQPFEWGANDCALFAADCVRALTGLDVVPTHLRHYASAKEAYRVLNRNGGLVGLATAALGPARPAKQAQIGDVVLTKAGRRDMLAVCNGRTALAPGPDGLVKVPFGSVCWRVG